MASIGDDPNGRKRILFVGQDGKRRTIRIGKATTRQAEAFKVRVERLISDTYTGHPPDEETAKWLAGLDARTLKRLERVSLIRPAARGVVTLEKLLAEFFAAVTVKESTRTAYAHVRRNLIEHFGGSRDIRTITPHDADKWRQYLQAEGLREATISKRVRVARQIFRKAERWKMLGENPFEGTKTGSQKNPSRQRTITRDMAQKVLDACPDAEWRLIVALSRFGGLRCPSEHMLLKWSNIDWDAGRLLITSPKTEHHPGGESRLLPLFPELRTYLLDAFEQAEPGAVYVITRYRDANQNLRTQFRRIIAKAGLTPWPKLFHNLRSSRQGELEESYPSHVVCKWMGNSERVARDHYLQMTDEHFRKAADAGPLEKAAQKTAQQPAAGARKGSQPVTANAGNPDICDDVRSDANRCNEGYGLGGTRTHTL